MGTEAIQHGMYASIDWTVFKVQLIVRTRLYTEYCGLFFFQSDDADFADRMYDLVSVVVHCGRY